MLENKNMSFIYKTLTFWDKLNSEDQTLILDNIDLVRYNQGENIHSGENDCLGILLVKSGELRTYMLSEDGREITLYRLSKGDVCILSASCILRNITFDVHVDAEYDSEALLIKSNIFQQICSRNIYAENFFYKITIDRFSDVMWTMQQILFMNFDKRLAIFLLDELSRSNSDSIFLTHGQIAKYIGSAREVVSRTLKYFENEGYVKLSRGVVKVIDKKFLMKLIS